MSVFNTLYIIHMCTWLKFDWKTYFTRMYINSYVCLCSQQTFKSFVKCLYLSQKPSYTSWASATPQHFTSQSRTSSFSWFPSSVTSNARSCSRWMAGSWLSWILDTSSATSLSALVNQTWTSSTHCRYFDDAIKQSVSSFNAASMSRLNESNHSDILALSASRWVTESTVTYWHSFWLNSAMWLRSCSPIFRSSTNFCREATLPDSRSMSDPVSICRAVSSCSAALCSHSEQAFNASVYEL